MITQAAADTHIDLSGVYAAFARLSGDDRDVIGLRIIAGFTTAQAAVGLGVTPAAVEDRLDAAWRRLRVIAPGMPEGDVAAALRSVARV
jgi:DNA-directed RNA polymerase specialized sigma24 family protein